MSVSEWMQMTPESRIAFCQIEANHRAAFQICEEASILVADLLSGQSELLAVHTGWDHESGMPAILVNFDETVNDLSQLEMPNYGFPIILSPIGAIRKSYLEWHERVLRELNIDATHANLLDRDIQRVTKSTGFFYRSHSFAPTEFFRLSQPDHIRNNQKLRYAWKEIEATLEKARLSEISMSDARTIISRLIDV